MVKCLTALLSFYLLSCAVYTGEDYPPQMRGYVQLSEGANVYYSRYEVTNEEYRVFLGNIARKDSIIWRKCRYDSTKWTIGPGDAPLAIQRVYHHHEAYREYPVVNISAYAAGQFCAWLNESAAAGVRYRLPTLAEQQELIAQLDTSSLRPQNESGNFRAPFANLKYIIHGVEDYDIDGASYTAPVSVFLQNKRRATSIIGNVSEMNSEGSRLGGGWNESPVQALSASAGVAGGPGIGFRVFAEVSNDSRGQ